MIKYLRPLIIIGISTAIAAVLYMLGQVSPKPVVEKAPIRCQYTNFDTY